MSKVKPKSVFSKIVFGRTSVIAILILVQIVIIAGVFFRFAESTPYVVGAHFALDVFIIIYIINQNSNPDFKLTWILIITIFPVMGELLYLFVKLNLGTVGLRNRFAEIIKETRGFVKTEEALKENLKKENPGLYNLSKYVDEYGNYSIFSNTAVDYYPLGEHKFKAMKEELEKAERFIFLEYFIIAEGIMWNSILEILERKVKEGVEVRVMFDGMGTLLTLPSHYERMLRKKGIKTKIFSPVVPMLSTHQNNRDHRKILVIDGKVAFNGGINLADEYIGKKVVYGHWKDVAVKLTGSAVENFTLMFLQMWNITERQPEDYFCYLNKAEKVKVQGYVMPYGDNPLDNESVGELVYTDILYKAEKYVHIMTPYLIIDNEMLTALTFAAKSGIDVKIIIPHIPDKKWPFFIARSFYNVLLAAGVQIYEYTQGFVHAKVFVSDDIKAVVGTINLDYRSLYHHFECATYMENVDAVQLIEEDFEETLKKCRQVEKGDYKKIPFIQRIMGRILRLVAPLM